MCIRLYVCLKQSIAQNYFDTKKHYKHLEVERPKGKNTEHKHIDFLFSVKQSEHLFKNGFKKIPWKYEFWTAALIVMMVLN